MAHLPEKPEKTGEAQMQALMAEGYREMAEENLSLAEQAFPLVTDMVLRFSRWDEP